ENMESFNKKQKVLSMAHLKINKDLWYYIANYNNLSEVVKLCLTNKFFGGLQISQTKLSFQTLCKTLDYQKIEPMLNRIVRHSIKELVCDFTIFSSGFGISTTTAASARETQKKCISNLINQFDMPNLIYFNYNGAIPFLVDDVLKLE